MNQRRARALSPAAPQAPRLSAGGQRHGPQPGPPQSQRHQLSTRAQIIEVAGRVFADKGFAAATGKEICEQAGVNAAAISYHFGGMVNLYHEVLREAYHTMVTLDAFNRLEEQDAGPEQRLRALCDAIVSGFLQPAGAGWEWRVICREALAPSQEIAELRHTQLVPKIVVLRDLVGELLQLPVTHPAVVFGCLQLMAPNVLMQVGDWTAVGKALPGFHIDAGNREELSRCLYAFIRDGLRAIAALYVPAPAVPAPAVRTQ
jgi:TetR/AcrR family transcriptional regulator, regulator of cefoperazone and chloramphenicol sensitivity